MNPGMLTDAPAVADVPDAVDAPDAVEDTASLQDQLALHDAMTETAAPVDDAAPVDATPDWTSDRMVKMDADFKETMGVGVKEAFDMFNEMRAELTTLRETKQQDSVTQAAATIQKAWGVNDAEFTRRATEVAAYVKTLPEATQAAVDNVDGVQLVWQHLQARKATSNATGGKPGNTTSGTPQSFSRADITRWMMTEPATYNKYATAIAAARLAGRITD
jgi:hypothetical protein